jgi:membrane associated rhomboid family serine protease
MILPLRTDSPLRRTPYMNWAIIAANVLMFVVQRVVWPDGRALPLSLEPRDPTIFGYITYQFLHANTLHLAGNMLFLYIFGNNVCDRMGNWAYLAFYLAGGVAAGIGHMFTSSAGVIGASGAVSAVTGAYLVLLPLSHITVFFFFFYIGTFEFPSVYFILLSVVKDFIMSGDGSSNVAHAAHLSGYIFGFLVSFVLLACKMLPRDTFDMFALYKQWNRRRQYRDLVQQGFDPFGHVPKSAQAVPNPNLDRIQDIRAQISEAMAHHKLEEAAKYYLELRAIDPAQVLSKQNHLDIANQLYAQQIYAAAADAYEAFIRFYPRYEMIEQIQLIAGLIYGQYLQRPDLSRNHLRAALERLTNPREIELARDHLARAESAVP